MPLRMPSIMSVYEVWEDPEYLCIEIFPSAERASNVSCMSDRAKRRTLIAASSWTRALTIHYQLMGWGTYVPIDE